ncbi:MAG: hypothetical protein H0X43_06925 [Nitrosospira sp.]|nr:hypothetical protein [Nitrosospira sp.]
MKHHSILKSKTAFSLLGAVFLTMTGLVHAQIETPGQGDYMQTPSDSMQPPVIPGIPFEEGTTMGEEAERKSRADNDKEQASPGDRNQDNGSKQNEKPSTGPGGY